ncbi:putative short chain dehydrogenase [Byssothecium circinans]|uniref:Putative short chain dehydrogenase n=1 Tax=Byssothecium circinans TaxID=147558 RepID=A0A6A5TPN5_9PLEO|nr:putative short chain dehydrogenase [Byssothecium circinans]
MASYVITGASKGLGWGFLEHLSADPSNTIIGVVRNAPPTVNRMKSEFPDRKNITILQADLNDRLSLKKAAVHTAKVTGGSLDYLIGNAAYISVFDGFDGAGDLIAKSSHDEFVRHFHGYMNTNVLGQIFLYDAFLPLVLKGRVKKVLSISTGMGDLDFNREWDHDHSLLYSASKAALNMVNVKFGAQYKKDGVLFLTVCPGVVDTGHYDGLTPEQAAKQVSISDKFAAYSPNFKGAYAPIDSVKMVLSVLDKSSVEKDQGKYVSHLGTKRWLP